MMGEVERELLELQTLNMIKYKISDSPDFGYRPGIRLNVPDYVYSTGIMCNLFR
jgi:hypothetical protein